MGSLHAADLALLDVLDELDLAVGHHSLDGVGLEALEQHLEEDLGTV